MNNADKRKELKLSDFKTVKNRQNPELCFAYEGYNKDKTEKYSLFTMNYGSTFLASVTSVNNSGKLVDTDFSQSFNSKEEGLDAINNFLTTQD